ncbi:MAG: imidazole glycerol phosphate synthase subunit HisH [Pseudomonadota bacterium]
MIVIVDYGMGNLASILNMLKRIGARAAISARPQDIAAAAGLILPGVGAFDEGMRALEEKGLLPVLNDAVLEQKKPVLGICLGMQLLTEKSEEGALPGLGWIAGETIRFRFGPEHRALKIPHMGWNTVEPTRADGLFRDLAEPAFYFVHSYHVICREAADVLAWCGHGYKFAAAVQRGHVMGTQFHPEKSHKYGLKLLTNFAELI